MNNSKLLNSISDPISHNTKNQNAIAQQQNINNESTIVRRNRGVKNAILHDRRILNFFGNLEEINISNVKIMSNNGFPNNKIILGAGD